MRWVIGFPAACLAAIAAVFALLWAFGVFAGLGLDGHGVIALALGVTLTAGLGVGLMALVFYSHRSERDETVYRAGHDERQ